MSSSDPVVSCNRLAKGYGDVVTRGLDSVGSHWDASHAKER
jgi:hypothetical protein